MMTYAELPADERARLVAAYGAGLSAGSGGPWMLDDKPETVALVGAITDDWFRGLETWQATRSQWPIDTLIPEWLRAAMERDAALGDATPPDGWGVDGRPV